MIGGVEEGLRCAIFGGCALDVLIFVITLKIQIDGFGLRDIRVSQDEDYMGFKCTLDNFIVHSSKGSLFI